MSEILKCNRCGAALPPDAPEGLCPRCLVALNLATQTEIADETGPHGTQVNKPPPAPPLPASEIAKLFPQLEILECLGRGGMGAVYKARQPRLDRIVALKILSPEKQGEPKFAERFEREARALARLHHPNIVTVYDFGEAQGNFYLLMEFVDGLTLRQLLQTKKLSPAEALGIVPKICEALQYAHEQGIVHRDIKPENILLDKNGRVKIADFGIAKIIGDGGRANLTAEQVIGTPHYMSPEQIEKPQTVDHRADIYSLGVVFYEMLTGELPLGKFQPPSQKVHIDVRLDEVVLRALEKEPSRRYQHVSEVKTQVETIAATPESNRSRGNEAQTEKPENQRLLTSSPTNLNPRFSRTAIAGAIGLPFSFVPVVWFVSYVRQMTQTTTPMTHDTSWLNISLGIAGFMGLVLVAPLVTSALGWVAVSQIRRSAGRLLGLKLALFDGLFFPLLMLDAMIGGLWVFLDKLLAVYVRHLGGSLFADAWDFLIWLTLLALTLIWVDSQIIRRVWRAVSRSRGDEAQTEKPENQRLHMSSPTKPDRFWRWFAVAVLLLIISIPCFIMLLFFINDAALQIIRHHAGNRSDYIGQAWFPEGDSIEITSVERTKDQMTVKGQYNLASHDGASLALYITTTNNADTNFPEDATQTMSISKGRGDFELIDSHVVPGLPHVSMYADQKPFASIYFGTKAEALEESKAGWITNVAPVAVTTDQVLVEHAAMHVLAAIRDKDDAALKELADERVEGWRDSLPEFAFELREKFHQRTGKPFDMHVSESLVRGDTALVECGGPKELNGDYLALFFVKNGDGWENCYLRIARASMPLKGFWEQFPAATELKSEDAAISAAQNWLALIDAGNYSESWKQACTFFQGAVTEPAWENSMNTFRQPLGALVSRKLISSQHMTELPGAPDGQYVLMQFETSFANKKSAIETVTFMLEKDGQWKSAGYFIK